MTITESNSRKLLPTWLSRPLSWLVTGLGSSDPRRIPHLGHAGNLLVKPALGLVTAAAGAGFPDVWDMGLVAHAQAAHEPHLCRLVRGRTDLVAVHPSLE